jgi:hypothetical protein
MAKIAVLISAALLAGCSVEGKIDEDKRNKLIECVHVEVNERFTYNTNTAKVSIGIGTGSTISLTDTDGWHRTMTEAEASKWKCRDKR